MRLALVQDQLLTCAGSERVFQYLAEEFAEADLFTLAYNADTTWPAFRRFRIRCSVLDGVIRTHHQFKLWFPVATYVMQWWNFRHYDVVLSSSATVAKYVRRHRGKHLCYCYFPTRAIWDSEVYFSAEKGWKTKLFRLLLPLLKRRDVEAARRVDRFIAISEVTRAEIRKNYGRESEVVPSPIDFDRFAQHSRAQRRGFYLLVSRLESWKRVDYAIEAFTALGLRLKVVGTGPEMASLMELAGPTIEFIGKLDDESLARLYGEASAVIFTPTLEYGLVPLEANAAGTPCIAYGRGGVLETMIGPCDAAGRPPTAIFFNKQTPEALSEAVATCEVTLFDRSYLTAHAANFAVPAFKAKMRGLVEEMAGEARLQGSPRASIN